MKKIMEKVLATLLREFSSTHCQVVECSYNAEIEETVEKLAKEHQLTVKKEKRPMIEGYREDVDYLCVYNIGDQGKDKLYTTVGALSNSVTIFLTEKGIMWNVHTTPIVSQEDLAKLHNGYLPDILGRILTCYYGDAWPALCAYYDGKIPLKLKEKL